MKRKLLTIVIVLTLILTLASCEKKENVPDTPDDTKVEDDVDVPNTGDTSNDTPEKDDDDTTDNTDDTTPEDDEGETETQLACGVISAADAARLYNEHEGGYVLHEITSLNSMYIVENGESIASIRDLEGKTVYVVDENGMGTFALKYILESNGLLDSVTITEESSDWIWKQMESSSETVCLTNLNETIDLLEEYSGASARINIAEIWKDLTGCRFYEGCIVSLRGGEWDDKVSELIKAWDAEVSELKDSADRWNLTYDERTVSGEYDMMDELTDFFMKLYKLSPELIGGSVPDDAFYSEG